MGLESWFKKKNVVPVAGAAIAAVAVAGGEAIRDNNTAHEATPAAQVQHVTAAEVPTAGMSIHDAPAAIEIPMNETSPEIPHSQAGVQPEAPKGEIPADQ